jgi:hypothetical protein
MCVGAYVSGLRAWRGTELRRRSHLPQYVPEQPDAHWNPVQESPHCTPLHLQRRVVGVGLHVSRPMSRKAHVYTRYANGRSAQTYPAAQREPTQAVALFAPALLSPHSSPEQPRAQSAPSHEPDDWYTVSNSERPGNVARTGRRLTSASEQWIAIPPQCFPQHSSAQFAPRHLPKTTKTKITFELNAVHMFKKETST